MGFDVTFKALNPLIVVSTGIGALLAVRVFEFIFVDPPLTLKFIGGRGRQSKSWSYR